jgi:hypothetical protein
MPLLPVKKRAMVSMTTAMAKWTKAFRALVPHNAEKAPKAVFRETGRLARLLVPSPKFAMVSTMIATARSIMATRCVRVVVASAKVARPFVKFLAEMVSALPITIVTASQISAWKIHAFAKNVRLVKYASSMAMERQRVQTHVLA